MQWRSGVVNNPNAYMLLSYSIFNNVFLPKIFINCILKEECSKRADRSFTKNNMRAP